MNVNTEMLHTEKDKNYNLIIDPKEDANFIQSNGKANGTFNIST